MTTTATLTLCGSISHHPGPLGSAIHRAGYQALGLPFTYVPFRTTDLEGAIRGARALGIRGLGVSMPFKVEVMRHLDAIDPVARRIGAVNTVVNDAGRLTGYNADADGAAAALAEATPIAGRRVLLVGAGGAARAIAHALADRGARLHVLNRARPAAEALAAAVGATAGALDELHAPGALAAFDVLIHATPLGMADQPGMIVPEAALHPGLVVMDIVYKPVRTALSEAALRRGARVVHGGRMLLYQAFRQFELYTGHPAPREAMAAALDAFLAG
jgi:shikimate dehydrogenase